MRPPPWKVGELARRTGISIRTLHYYDEIGLLMPSHHTESGHRLYTERDVARLQQVLSLRELGLSLEDVRACLNRPDFEARRVIRMHLSRLREQIELQQRLCRKLEVIEARLGSAETVSVEELLQAIEGIVMIENYYTPEQLKELEERGRQVGAERIRQVEEEWPRLMAEVRAEMDKGTDPASPAVQDLARRWRALVNEFTGGNPEIEKSLRRMYEQEPNIHGMDTGPVREMAAYIEKALAASKGG